MRVQCEQDFSREMAAFASLLQRRPADQTNNENTNTEASQPNISDADLKLMHKFLKFLENEKQQKDEMCENKEKHRKHGKYGHKRGHRHSKHRHHEIFEEDIGKLLFDRHGHGFGKHGHCKHSHHGHHGHRGHHLKHRHHSDKDFAFWSICNAAQHPETSVNEIQRIIEKIHTAASEEGHSTNQKNASETTNCERCQHRSRHSRHWSRCSGRWLLNPRRCHVTTAPKAANADSAQQEEAHKESENPQDNLTSRLQTIDITSSPERPNTE